MKKLPLALLLLLLSVLAAPRPVSAAPPTTLTYLGQLLVSGSPVSGPYDFQFSLWTASTGGTQVGTTVSVPNVNVQMGVYYAEINFGSAIAGQTLYLQASYSPAGAGTYTAQTPRHLVPASSYADYAALSGYANSAGLAGTANTTKALQGKALSTTAPTTGQVLTYNGTLWAPAVGTPGPQGPAGAQGVAGPQGIQGIPGPTYSAGTGLALSGTTFSIPNGGITSALLGAGSVTTAALANGSVTAGKLAAGASSPTGAAGGDLTGTYPNPTVNLNAIDHTKLALDAVSLGQVTNGSMATFASTRNIGTWPNSYIGPNTSDYFTYEGQAFGNAGLGWYADTWNGGNGLTSWVSGYGGIKLFTASTPRLEITSSGNVGIGTESPQTTLDVNGGIAANYESHFSNGTYNDPAVGIGAGLKVSGGLIADTVTANSLQLTGGSDLAEPYQIAPAANVQPAPGLVVSIDPAHTGQMRVCTRAYDATVGGIISGANGIQPGITLRQAGTVADGALPIASAGRVWCWCDADAGGAISPGDLLTTSATPGHAMKAADHARAQGAIIGKAMSPLASGKGLVLVLVSLQ